MLRSGRAFNNSLTTRADTSLPPMQQPPPVDRLLTDLTTFPRDLTRLLSGAELDWKLRRQAGEWSLTEVICHLRDVEREVHQERFEVLIREDGAFLPGAVADAWVTERGYQAQNGKEALGSFLVAREQTVALLEGLDESLWQRQGQHAFFGPTSMHELLYLAVQHDQAHWEQIVNLLDE